LIPSVSPALAQEKRLKYIIVNYSKIYNKKGVMLLAERNNASNKGGDVKRKETGNKTTSIVIIILLVVLIAVGAVLIYVLTRGDSGSGGNEALIPRETVGPGEITGGRGTVVTTPEEYQAKVEELNRPNPDKSYRVNMSTEWRFDTWDTPSSTTFVKNLEINSRTVYVDFFLNSEDSELGDLIYSSPYIPLGEELRNFALDKEVAAGEYPATVVFHLVDDEYNDIMIAIDGRYAFPLPVLVTLSDGSTYTIEFVSHYPDL